MEMDIIDNLAKGWIAEHSTENLDKNAVDTDGAYFDKLVDLIYGWRPDLGDHQTAWQIILRMIELTNEEITIANIAAGPLESLIAQHGPQYLDSIRTQARNDPRFLLILKGVWKNQSSNEIWMEIQQIIKEYG
jgi:hypothetical protein